MHILHEHAQGYEEILCCTTLPAGASCLMPPPKREPIPAAMITNVVFRIPLPKQIIFLPYL